MSLETAEAAIKANDCRVPASEENPFQDIVFRDHKLLATDDKRNIPLEDESRLFIETKELYLDGKIYQEVSQDDFRSVVNRTESGDLLEIKEGTPLFDTVHAKLDHIVFADLPLCGKIDH